MRIHARCGCGHGFWIYKLAAAKKCPNCRWAIVWTQPDGSFTVSRHVHLSIFKGSK